MSLTTDPNDPKLREGQKNKTGQHDIYLVLSEEERAKGFVRPVRQSYVHRGKKVKIEPGGVLRDLTDEERERYKQWNYAGIIDYSDEYCEKNGSSVIGRFIDQKEYEAIKNNVKYIGGCGGVTTMGLALAETYARDPKFYGATFCCGCNKHLPVSEFVWDGTNEELGS